MCSVVGCDSWRRKTDRFKLPEDPERRLEWVQFLFEVNGQRLKESSCTDITICYEHFTRDCFEQLSPSGTVQLKPSAVPSLRVKSEPDEPEPCQSVPLLESEEATEVASQHDPLYTSDSPSYSEGSGLTATAAQQSPALSNPSDAFISDHSQVLRKNTNIHMLREKAAPLLIKGKYAVNEKHLQQMLNHECPSCGSEVKMEITSGKLLILTQQCLQCEYRNQWRSQVSGSIPAAQDQVEITPETQQIKDDCHVIKDSSGVVTVTEEESEGTEESSDVDSDDESVEETEEEEEDGDYPPLPTKYSRLCSECGKFFNKKKPHTCEHKTKPYCCNICGKRCVSEVALNIHGRVHDENYKHQCKYCQDTFKTKVDKLTHQQIHRIQGKPYKCPDCSETFATNKERGIHLEDHRGPKQLKCHICGIDFTQTGHLQRHMAVHTGEKPFKCSVCQRGFNQASHLKSHMRLHTGERPFQCQHCDKSFNHNVSLKSHVQRYHSSSSGREGKKGKAQENGSERGADSGLNDVEEECDEEEEVQKERRLKKRSTGRPKGRPKREAEGNLVAEGETGSRRSNTKTAKVKAQKLKRRRCSDEESEDEPAESMSFDSTEEDSEKVTLSRNGSRGR